MLYSALIDNRIYLSTANISQTKQVVDLAYDKLIMRRIIYIEVTILKLFVVEFFG